MGAARPGGRPAVVTPDGVLTHRELGARVDRLARALVAAGVGPEVVCAIALERGVDAVVAMAAVLRAHGAFLTVDTDLPAKRVAALLSEARVLVSASGVAERFAVPGPTVLVDAPDVPGAVLPEGEPDSRSLAYVSHTSGSTGVPNAVLVEHRSLRSYLRSAVRDNDLGPDTVVLQLAPMGYDASIRDTLAPLLAGGSVVVLPRSALLRPEELFAAVRAHGVNAVLSTTPSFLTFLSRQAGAAEALRGVRLVATSGESLRPFLAAGGRALLPGRLVNQYGPTECTMTSTRHEVPRAPEDADLVGRPIEGVVVRLLDRALREVPDGAVGEVHLGGIGVARGYAGRPGLTAERFVPDPLGGPGERLYRTGDLARRRPDGALEYLGRDDRQIKVRGHRVDPAEVEAVLLAHPSITGAAVTPATDAQQRTYLVAHVTGEVAGLRDAALRAHLADALPPHLMPRRFTRLDRFPTTRSGKVDRAALAAGAR